MKHRVQLDFTFENLDDAWAFWQTVKNASKKAIAITPGERSTANIHECNHDESSPKPCKIIEQLTLEKNSL